jgi:hypothetical protein
MNRHKDTIVPRWEERGGFVYVDGQKVLGGDGSKGVKAPPEPYLAPCQRCKVHKIPRRMVLLRRFESARALQRWMFWFAIDPREKRIDVCPECAAGIDGVIR